MREYFLYAVFRVHETLAIWHEVVYNMVSVYFVNKIILDSSAVEHSAVNRRVVGSNPTRGVKIHKFEYL